MLNIQHPFSRGGVRCVQHANTNTDRRPKRVRNIIYFPANFTDRVLNVYSVTTNFWHQQLQVTNFCITNTKYQHLFQQKRFTFTLYSTGCWIFY